MRNLICPLLNSFSTMTLMRMALYFSLDLLAGSVCIKILIKLDRFNPLRPQLAPVDLRTLLAEQSPIAGLWMNHSVTSELTWGKGEVFCRQVTQSETAIRQRTWCWTGISRGQLTRAIGQFWTEGFTCREGLMPRTIICLKRNTACSSRRELLALGELTLTSTER